VQSQLGFLPAEAAENPKKRPFGMISQEPIQVEDSKEKSAECFSQADLPPTATIVFAKDGSMKVVRPRATSRVQEAPESKADKRLKVENSWSIKTGKIEFAKPLAK
jgi:hypothetical protein